MHLSIIIISYNTKEILRECLNKIKQSTDKLEKEIIIVDNASTDGSTAMLKYAFPGATLIENKENIGFARANIQGAGIAKGKYILLLNPDAFIAEDSIEKTINFMEKNPSCGISGVRMVNKEGQLQLSARYFPTPWRLFLMYSGIAAKFPHVSFLRGIDGPIQNYNFTHEVDWVAGPYFLIRREVIEKIGFFDKDYYMYYEEIDFCLKSKKNGWKIMFYPETEVVHLGGESAKKIGTVTPKGKQLEDWKLQSEFIYFRKNHGISYVFLDLFFIILLNISEIFKRIIIGKKYINISEKIRHIKKAYEILVMTNFGTKSVN